MATRILDMRVRDVLRSVSGCLVVAVVAWLPVLVVLLGAKP